MEFQNNKAIYQQLADLLCLGILEERYTEEGRIPSVRDFASEAEVNANTAVRAYEWLQQHDIIYTKRGLGYFVMSGAKAKIQAMRRQTFMHDELPSLMRNMQVLGLTIDDIAAAWSEFNNNVTLQPLFEGIEEK